MNPLRLVPRVRRAYAELDVLERRETWPRAEVERLQLDRINRLWSTARVDVPHYRDVAAEHDLPARFESIAHYVAEMPLLPKDVLRADLEISNVEHELIQLRQRLESLGYID